MTLDKGSEHRFVTRFNEALEQVAVAY